MEEYPLRYALDDLFSKGITDLAVRNIASSVPSSRMDGVRDNYSDSDLEHTIVRDTQGYG